MTKDGLFFHLEAFFNEKLCQCANVEIKYPNESGLKTVILEGHKSGHCPYHDKPKKEEKKQPEVKKENG